jgi:hypothetical protein
MGKHAAPRKPLLGRPAAKRATAVSVGTFVLCLGAAAPAFAATSTPTPPPVPQPISDTVQQVSDTLGVPDPLADDSTSAPKHHRTSKPTSKAQAQAAHTRTVSRTGTPAKHPAVAAPTMFALAALHNPRSFRTEALSGRQPAMADNNAVTRIAPAAANRALIHLPGTPAQQDTERILLVAAATLLLGGLSSGHLKAAQRRMIAW